MYEVAVRRKFSARHALIGGDFGSENTPHAHAYQIELRCEGAVLDQHGFLVDIDHVKRELNRLLARYAGCMLNEQPELAGQNPTLENFARVIALDVAAGFAPGALTGLVVTLWEDDDAWASFTWRP